MYLYSIDALKNMVNAGQLPFSSIQWSYNFIFKIFELFLFISKYLPHLSTLTLLFFCQNILCLILPEVDRQTTDETQQKQCLHSDANIPPGPIGCYSIIVFPQLKFGNKYFSMKIFTQTNNSNNVLRTRNSKQEVQLDIHLLPVK